MHFYKSHMAGQMYTTTNKLEESRLHCDGCNGVDTYLGEANTKEEAWKVLTPHTNRTVTPDIEDYDNFVDENGNLKCCVTGGYDRKYVEEIIESIDWERELALKNGVSPSKPFS